MSQTGNILAIGMLLYVGLWISYRMLGGIEGLITWASSIKRTPETEPENTEPETDPVEPEPQYLKPGTPHYHQWDYAGNCRLCGVSLQWPLELNNEPCDHKWDINNGICTECGLLEEESLHKGFRSHDLYQNSLNRPPEITENSDIDRLEREGKVFWKTVH